jgi:hypothetical protein
MHEVIEFPSNDVVPGEVIDERPTEEEAPRYHTILEVWREVLKPAHAEVLKNVTPQWAGKMVQSYPQIKYSDCEDLRDRYYAKLFQLEAQLLQEIGTDENCLTWETPEEDVQHNSHHYKNLLLQWQLSFMQWELDWRSFHKDAAVELAAIGECHIIMFGSPERQGLTAFLGNVKFELTEDDQAEIQAELNALREQSEADR